jgi:fatty acid-binding protein DegV
LIVGAVISSHGGPGAIGITGIEKNSKLYLNFSY